MRGEEAREPGWWICVESGRGISQTVFRVAQSVGEVAFPGRLSGLLSDQ